ncbi:MAG TPA: PLP-dependent aminotransferase family protein [Solirubrobacterales bacterium]|nr:PLP-dependent aminotransferase family protein [Solirubrobacterales bacterium]
MGTNLDRSGELALPQWDPEKPRRAQLEALLREAIRGGRLRPAARLPSSRVLATQLGVSRRLVVEAYEQLAAEGYLATRRGSGTTVSPHLQLPAAGGPEESTAPPERPARIDLFPGAPELSLFPRRAWGRALRRALETLPDARLNYGGFAGEPELRAALADHLGRVRAAVAAPDRVLVTSGYQQGLRVFCQLVRNRGGRRIAVEDPGFPLASWTIESERLETVPVAIDDDGVDVDSLVASKPDAVVVTPAHSLPLGAVLAPDRRRHLVAWARERNVLVLEDDYDAELRYDRGPAGALQGLAPDVVVLAGTVSKTLAPALRLGWLLLPGSLVGEAVALRAAADGGGPRIEELALAELVAGGGFDRHLRAARNHYRAKRALLVGEVAARMPAVRVRGIAAGLHAVLMLPDGVEEEPVIATALEAGVLVHGLGTFTRAHRAPPGLVVGYGLPSERQLREAIAIIAAAIGPRAKQRPAAPG